MRRSIGWCLVTVLAASAAVAACTTENAAVVQHGSGGGDDDDDAGGSKTSTSSSSSSSSSSGSSPLDSGSTTPTPAPTGTTTVPDAGPPFDKDPFSTADAFTSKAGPDGHHNAGQDCMNGCHDHGFTFSGTLTNAGGQAISGAEIRLVTTDGTQISVYSATNGNFYSTQRWEPPAYVGVRNAAEKTLMTDALEDNQIGCNACHSTGGGTAKITLP